MKKTKQRILSAIALTAASILLAGCGSVSVGQGEPEADSVTIEEVTGAAETSDASETDADDDTETSEESEKSEESGDETEGEPVELSKKEMKQARKVIEAFFAALKNNDVDAVLANSNMHDSLLIWEGEDLTDEEITEMIQEEFEEGYVEYSIGEGTSQAENIAKYNEKIVEYYQQIEEDFAELEDEEKGEYEILLYKIAQSLFKPIDGLVVFPVDITDEDGCTETEDIYVIRMDGKWTVDVVLVSFVLGSDDEPDYGVVSANMNAKSVYNALNCALVDMDCVDYPVTKLDGEFYLTGDDFDGAEQIQLNDNHAAAPEELMQELEATAMLYFSDITELDGVAIVLEKGCCTAVAVENADGDFGTYPIQMTEDNEAIETLEGALAYAKAQ